MFPVRDVIPSQTMPVATVGLIAINGLVFLHEFSLVAHSPAALGNLRWGAAVARRAWLEPAAVLNTRPIDQCRALLRRNRR